MKTKICPICDQAVKGNYCKTCRKFVKPVVFESTFRLNESSLSRDYMEIQLETRASGEPNKCYTPHPAPNVPDSSTVQRNPNQCNTPHPAPNVQATRPAYEKNYESAQKRTSYTGEVTKKKSSAGGKLVIIFLILAVIQFLLPLLIGIFSIAETSSYSDYYAEQEITAEPDNSLLHEGWDEANLESEQITLDEAREYAPYSTGLVSMGIDARLVEEAVLGLLDEKGILCEGSRTEEFYKTTNTETGEVLTYCLVYNDYSFNENEYYTMQEDALNGSLVYVSYMVKDVDLAAEMAAQVLMEVEGISQDEALEILSITEESMEEYYSVVYNEISFFGFNDGDDEYMFMISAENY